VCVSFFLKQKMMMSPLAVVRTVFVFLWFWLCLGIIFAGLYPFQFKPFRLDTARMFCLPGYCDAGNSTDPDALLTNHICFVTQQLFRTRTLYANHAPIVLTEPWEGGSGNNRGGSYPHHIVTILAPPAETGCQVFVGNTRRSLAPGTLVLLADVPKIQVLGVGTKIWTWRLNWGKAARGATVSSSHKKKWRVITDRKYRFPAAASP